MEFTGREVLARQRHQHRSERPRDDRAAPTPRGPPPAVREEELEGSPLGLSAFCFAHK